VNPAYVGAPYFPLTTPPASGNNFFTDTSGQIWASRNGSAWVRANQMCRARMTLNGTGQSLVNGYNILNFDGTDYDPMAGAQQNPGQYTVPLAGDYFVTAGWVSVDIPLSGASTASTVNCNITKNGTTYASGGQGSVAGGAQNGTGADIVTVVSAVAGDVIRVRAYTNQPCTTYTGGLYFQFFTIHRMN
jgi:hypothetical protein